MSASAIVVYVLPSSSSAQQRPPPCEFCSKRPTVYAVGAGWDRDPLLACNEDLATAVQIELLDQKAQHRLGKLQTVKGEDRYERPTDPRPGEPVGKRR